MRCPICEGTMIKVGVNGSKMDVYECPDCGYQENLDCNDGR